MLDGDGDVGVMGVGEAPAPTAAKTVDFARNSASWVAAEGTKKRGSKNESRINALEKEMGVDLDGDGDIGERGTPGSSK